MVLTLIQAVREGHEEVVQLLVDNGADADVANHAGITPRSLADRIRRSDIVAVLSKLSLSAPP